MGYTHTQKKPFKKCAIPGNLPVEHHAESFYSSSLNQGVTVDLEGSSLWLSVFQQVNDKVTQDRPGLHFLFKGPNNDTKCWQVWEEMCSLYIAACKLILSPLSAKKIKNSLNIYNKEINSLDPYHGILCKMWLSIHWHGKISKMNIFEMKNIE